MLAGARENEILTDDCIQKAHKDRITALSRAKISASAVMDPGHVFDDDESGAECS